MYKRLLYISFLIMLIVCSIVNAATFSLKEHVSITKEYVYLYDIIDVIDADRKIENVRLFRTPNSETTYKTADIYSFLTKVVSGNDYIVIGQATTVVPNVTITRENTTTSSSSSSSRTTTTTRNEPVAQAHAKSVAKNPDNKILSTALIRVLPTIDNDEEYYKLKYLYKIPAVDISSTGRYVSAVIKSGADKNVKTVRFNIKDSSGKMLDWFETVVEVHKMKDVYKSVEYMSKGTIVEPNRFEVVAMRSDRLPSDCITDIAVVSDQAIDFHIKSDTVLRMFHIKTDMLIKRGDKVRASFEQNGLKIEIDATALENGYANKQIKLKNSKTGKEILAYIGDNKDDIKIVN